MFRNGKALYRRTYTQSLKASSLSPIFNRQPISTYFFRFSLGLLSFLTVVWIAQQLYDPHTMPIDHIKVQGDFPEDFTPELKRAILSFTQEGMLRLNVTALSKRLQENSWVETVKIKRIFPNSLHIQLMARKPIAIFQSVAADGSETKRLFDETGYLFELKNKNQVTSELPCLIGPMAQSKQLLRYYREIEAILNVHQVKVSILRLDTQQRIYMKLNNNIELQLGHINPINQLRQLLSIYPLILHQPHKVASIDLRYPRGMAIKRHEGESIS